jgi:fructose-1,6-bisphosphatase/inositol monophosphatase family enzyme
MNRNNWKDFDKLSTWWCRKLGDHAEDVIETIRDNIFIGGLRGELRTKVNAAAHTTGDPAIKLDELANSEVRKLCAKYHDEVLKEYQLNIITVGEEETGGPFGVTEQIDKISSDQLVVVVDPLDGSTNAKTFGCGYSTVLISFITDDRGGYLLVGGAIADSNGYTVIWQGSSDVLARHRGMQKGEYRPLRKFSQPSPAVAAVATKPSRLKSALHRMEQIKPGISDSALLMTMAGTPSCYALCALGLGMVVEPNETKCWDSAHLYPALILGLEAKTFPRDSESEHLPINISQVNSYFGLYLDSIRNKPKPVVPPFYIKN